MASPSDPTESHHDPQNPNSESTQDEEDDIESTTQAVSSSCYRRGGGPKRKKLNQKKRKQQEKSKEKLQMEWLVVAFSLIVIWVASLCKILFGDTSNSKAAIFKDGENPLKKNVLFVIAHPDDESMFFSPTINYLNSNSYNLYMLCLSTGNADGMGSIRNEELHQACAVLKIPLQQLKVLDHPNLQDGFGQVWSHDLLTRIIEEEVTKYDIHTIITFDGHGVSGHCNHRDVYHGVLKFLQTNSRRDIKAWELTSLNIFRKYIGPVDVWLSILSAKKHPSKVIIINKQPRKSFEAMAQHLSQWVWFRKLFVSFSSYTYVNTLHRINP